MSFEIIKDQSGLTPEWMTAVLRSSGTIDDRTIVTGLEAKDLVAEGGLLSELFRVTMTYEGGTGPATAIVKLPIDDETQRFTADVLGFYARELAFYDQIAPGAPFGAPAVYGSKINTDDTDFVLVMEDAGGLRTIDQRDGVPLDETRTVLSEDGRVPCGLVGAPRHPGPHPHLPAGQERRVPGRAPRRVRWRMGPMPGVGG